MYMTHPPTTAPKKSTPFPLVVSEKSRNFASERKSLTEEGDKAPADNSLGASHGEKDNNPRPVP